MRSTKLESDVFKFHLRKLITIGYVEKTTDGQYHLTVPGKQFANRLDNGEGIRHQPKLSILVVAERVNDLGERQFLLHTRHRHPYWGHHGFISGPVFWGEPLEAAAIREFKKQTSLHASFEIIGFCRLRHIAVDGSVMGDRLFSIVHATNVFPQPSENWASGVNQWASYNTIAIDRICLPPTINVLAALDTRTAYIVCDTPYDPNDY